MGKRGNSGVSLLQKLRIFGWYSRIYSKRRLLSWLVGHQARLSEFEQKHLRQSCFVIGNGPSLNRMDLASLRHCYSFGLNKLYLHPQFEDLQIDYHVAVNPLVIEQGIESFAAMRCKSFLSYEPCFVRNLVSRSFYYLITGGPHRFSAHPYEPICDGCTVTYVALQLAYFMGFQTVYLIGIDHDFSAQGTPNETQTLQGEDSDHFHPDYFSGQEWQLPDLEGSRLSYELAKYYFERDGRQIYDATVDGKLEVFPKLSYDEALSRCATESGRLGGE